MEERLQDVIDNCQIILSYLKNYDQTDSTPQGRMIAQCKWFIEQIGQNKLRLPVEGPYTSTLGHVYAEGYLRKAFKPDQKAISVINIAMYRLLNLVDDGRYLLKKIYYPYALRCTDALISLR